MASIGHADPQYSPSKVCVEGGKGEGGPQHWVGVFASLFSIKAELIANHADHQLHELQKAHTAHRGKEVHIN